MDKLPHAPEVSTEATFSGPRSHDRLAHSDFASLAKIENWRRHIYRLPPVLRQLSDGNRPSVNLGQPNPTESPCLVTIVLRNSSETRPTEQVKLFGCPLALPPILYFAAVIIYDSVGLSRNQRRARP